MMKHTGSRFWRPIRCLFLVVCAGGILAADNTWISPFDFDFAYTGAWFSDVPMNDSRLGEVALLAPEEIHPRAQLSMGQLINGLLFSPSARGWTLGVSADESQSPFGGRITEFNPINQIQRSDNFGVFSAPASVKSVSVITRAASGSPITPNTIITTGTGTWNVDASGNWSDAGNWLGGNVPDGATTTANFAAVDLSANRIVTLDVSRTVGVLSVGDTNGSNSYTIAPGAGASLTFDNGGATATLNQTSSSGGDTISAPLFLKGDLDISNSSATKPLTISGNLSSNAPTGGFQTLSFIGGTVNVSGNITTGTSTQLSVDVRSGLVTFTGANTYNGGTYVQGGTLLVNGTNSNTSFVQVTGSGTLGGTGTITTGIIYMYGGHITGATDTTVGTLTLNTTNLVMATNEGIGGTYIANLSGNTSDLLDISGILTLGSQTTLDIRGLGDGTTTYILAEFASHSGTFQTAMGVPPGYTLVYNPTDIELVPTAIPEPATWIGGALALGVMALRQRRRLRHSMLPRR
jgi:autotransporter-associated beta strand protein